MRIGWIVMITACAAAAPAPKPASPTPPTPPLTHEAAEPTPQVCRDEAAFARAGSAGVAGDLDKTGIRHVIREHIGEISACYAAYLAHGDQAGSVRATFTVTRGRVTRAEVAGFDDELDRCVCEVVARLAFPAFTAVINYPFTFEPPRG